MAEELQGSEESEGKGAPFELGRIDIGKYTVLWMMQHVRQGSRAKIYVSRRNPFWFFRAGPFLRGGQRYDTMKPKIEKMAD